MRLILASNVTIFFLFLTPSAWAEICSHPIWHLVNHSGQSAYVFASQHSKPQKICSINVEVANAIRDSGVVYFEAERGSISRYLREKSDTGENTYRTLIGPARLKRIQSLLKLPDVGGKPLMDSIDIPPAVLAEWIVTNLPCGWCNGLPFTQKGKSPDAQVRAIAAEAAKPINALERGAYSEHEKLAPLAQLLALDAALNIAESSEKQRRFADKSRELFALIDRLTIDRLPRELMDVVREFGLEALTEIMLDARTKIFAEAILNANREHSIIFVAVGAAHVGGENGLLALLKNKGYTELGSAEGLARPLTSVNK
jgi:uncharacterized protein YbaP (TraB family)